ncbi:MAG: hypothetical protein JWO36_7297 [Myxococcales bacterium]|nr:hypothetical protein [Myxococcales bacterium]
MTMIAVLWVGVVSSIALLLAVHLVYWKDARETRRDSSRFAMFAVRDRLVYLVAFNEMKESDPAWQLMYFTVNHMLDLSYDSSILSVLIRNARHAARVAKDVETRMAVRVIEKLIKDGERQTPEFGKVVKRMELALQSMSKARTPDWQWSLLLLIVVIVVPVVFIKRTARELFFNQSAAAAATLWQRHPSHLLAKMA